jgi:membrane-bound lytic murein transglycosylase B
LALAGQAGASMLQVDGVTAFIESLERKHGFDAAELRGLFADVERRNAVLDAIRDPAEAKPWHAYRSIFVTDQRIQRGAEFVRAHRRLLDRVRAEYGVPPTIVAAILGVETFYGERTGNHAVLDALVTLGFVYPPRSDFFRSELEQFLLLAREEALPLRQVTGSYAGAMGMPQFIASSYRRYAVDFDGDGQRDLWGSTPDAVGSIGSYLARHGWQAGEAVVHRVRVVADAARELTGRGLEPSVTAEELAAAGIRVEPMPGPHRRVTVVEVAGEEAPQFWVGRSNFYVITRYNHSPLYALAVDRLARGVGDRLAASDQP